MNDPDLCKPNLSRLTEHLRRVTGERNFQTSPSSLIQTQSYLQEQLESYGFEVHREPFFFSGQTFSNLVARLALNPNRPRLLVGAHFDSVSGSPGADDNASGVAAFLETARLYAQGRTEKSAVEFVAFNLEEHGMIGSQAYAQQLKKERVPLSGMLSLEMVGYASKDKGSQKMPFFLKPFYPDAGDFIGLVANRASAEFLKKAEKIFRSVEMLPVETLVLPANGWIFPAARLSDHSPFWDQNYPALLVTDTSFYRNPNYHVESDTVETLDLEFLANVTEAVARTVMEFGRF